MKSKSYVFDYDKAVFIPLFENRPLSAIVAKSRAEQENVYLHLTPDSLSVVQEGEVTEWPEDEPKLELAETMISRSKFAWGKVVAGKGLNSLGSATRGGLRTALGIVCCLTIYGVPTGVAVLRGQPNAMSIFLLNTFLGWTLIGWVVALVWAAKAKE